MIKKIDLSKLFFAAYEKTIEAMVSGGFSNDKSTFCLFRKYMPFANG
jgi:hypothetical protein